jgi:hypothetical protein
MKWKNNLFSYINSEIAKGDISFMPKSGERSNFAKYIANRIDIDPNGMFDIVAHGNSDLIEIENNKKTITIKARDAAKLIRRQPGFRKAKSIRLFSCNTGSTANGFAQNLANALGKPVFAPNMTIYANARGSYWISNGVKRGEFIKFIPGGYKNGK